MKATKENILAYLQEIKADYFAQGFVKLALFGSFARGDENVYSDIDIAIAKEEAYAQKRGAYTYFNKVQKLQKQIEKKFHRKIDIFDLDSDSSFKQSILKELIYV
jgi:predicted nucleotidyltransferase